MILELEKKNPNGWRHFCIGRLRFGWKFGRTRLGYHSMGDGDASMGLGFATVLWIWMMPGGRRTET